MAATNTPAEAERLLRFLASPEVGPALRESGLEP
jgi:molybdate transport system substrate-binding protein